MAENAAPKLTDGSEEVVGFYDSIADDYQLAVSSGDLRDTAEAHGQHLETIIATRLQGSGPFSVLDCSCGIGTQAIGLALRGHDVVGTDLSPRAVDRARREAKSLGVSATFAVGDMRRLDVDVDGEFDVVLSCGNSLAHFGPGELSTALLPMLSKVRPGGIVLASVRDYDTLAELRPRVPSLPRVHDAATGKRIIFQLWDWEADASAYLMTWLFLSEGPGGWETRQVSTTLHAHRRAELGRRFESAGFAEPVWHLPVAGDGFEDPVLTALRP